MNNIPCFKNKVSPPSWKNFYLKKRKKIFFRVYYDLLEGDIWGAKRPRYNTAWVLKSFQGWMEKMSIVYWSSTAPRNPVTQYSVKSVSLRFPLDLHLPTQHGTWLHAQNRQRRAFPQVATDFEEVQREELCWVTTPPLCGISGEKAEEEEKEKEEEEEARR